MTERAISISLKIPDNTAYTALVALRRLGVDVARVERSEIWIFDDGGDVRALTRRIESDETIFNLHKHRLELLDRCAPRAGEVWIEPLCHPEERALRLRSGQAPRASRRAKDEGERIGIAWRLFGADGAPVSRGLLDMAAERLLCNPAIEKVTR